jgi:hypothetical protein
VLQGYLAADGSKVAGYVAAGVVVNVLVAQEIALPVVGMLTIAATFDGPTVVAEVTSVLFTYIQNIPVGEPYLEAVATAQVMKVPGVTNWMPVLPLPYVGVSLSAKLMPSTFQIVGWFTATTTVTTQTSGVLA